MSEEIMFYLTDNVATESHFNFSYNRNKIRKGEK